ncbi:MAG: hypothetical protein ACREJN_07815, partial [Nitrospiraceae bacterium]
YPWPRFVAQLLDCFLLVPRPMPLVQRSRPFDDPDWLYEIKHDGFRAMAVIESIRLKTCINAPVCIENV